MPMAPLRRCLDCPTLTRHPRCPACQGKQRTVETRFSTGLYGRPWRRAVQAWIAEAPDDRAFCAECQAEGKQVLAEETDHIEPHRGDRTRFWDRTNWQRLCRAHHSRKTAAEVGWTVSRTGGA